MKFLEVTGRRGLCLLRTVAEKVRGREWRESWRGKESVVLRRGVWKSGDSLGDDEKSQHKAEEKRIDGHLLILSVEVQSASCNFPFYGKGRCERRLRRRRDIEIIALHYKFRTDRTYKPSGPAHLSFSSPWHPPFTSSLSPLSPYHLPSPPPPLIHSHAPANSATSLT